MRLTLIWLATIVLSHLASIWCFSMGLTVCGHAVILGTIGAGLLAVSFVNRGRHVSVTRRSGRLAFGLFCAFPAMYVVSLWPWYVGSRAVWTDALTSTAERGERIVDAIGAFEQRRGRAPAFLRELTPEFLDQLPGTGLAPFPAFGYRNLGHSGGWELFVELRQGLGWTYHFVRLRTEADWDAVDENQSLTIEQWAYVLD